MEVLRDFLDLGDNGTMTFGKRLRYYRKQAGWGQKELAAHVKVSTQAVSKWEQDRSRPDRKSLAQLLHALKKTESEFFAKISEEDEKVRSLSTVQPPLRVSPKVDFDLAEHSYEVLLYMTLKIVSVKYRA